MRALQVNLDQEVTHNDAIKILSWMENHEVTKYLNESSTITSELQSTINKVNTSIMTHLFNRNGSFYLICTDRNHPIGFLKLVHKSNEAEMVIVIGDNRKWGLGLGTEAIKQGLNQAFFHWRIPRVIAKISSNNIRSIKAFEKAGFLYEKDLTHSKLYSISLETYIKDILN
ncbi:MAG: N-acetyltransferase [Herbinix sp.]|jgi:RimJ/RimL family protein N-acetyltransferase|nr:N-acetyltransferase [Herbinix sp.]